MAAGHGALRVEVQLGKADYVEHRGERPIAITWNLRTPMPAADFAAASVVV